MLRLEKVFQNDDKFFINFSNIFKSLIIYVIIYLFSILEKNSIYEILDYKIYQTSDYFKFSLIVFLSFYIFSNSFFKEHKHFFNYNLNIIKKDFINLILSFVISILITFFFERNISINYIYLIITLLIFLYITQLMMKNFYLYLVNRNIIQKNILLIGNYESVKKILNEKKNNIYVYKCCILTDRNNAEIVKLRSEIRIPIFKTTEDIRSLLEYHSLGQIWIIDDNNINKNEIIKIVIKFSVDILIINISKKYNDNNLINGKYHFDNYEISRFHGSNFLIKIFLDKIFSLLFLTILSPLLLISIIIIYLEDGSPILFTQDRTGWDGRRFKIYKLRSLKKISFNKAQQVVVDDKRLLKIGKFLRKFSIDEVPQFINVLKGDMSIVGPRPHMVEHDIHYSNLFKEFLKRHKANPGLTGWAQIQGLRGPTDDEQMKKRMEMDLWYLNNWSVSLDILIILKTFLIIFKHKGT